MQDDDQDRRAEQMCEINYGRMWEMNTSNDIFFKKNHVSRPESDYECVTGVYEELDAGDRWCDCGVDCEEIDHDVWV